MRSLCLIPALALAALCGCRDATQPNKPPVDTCVPVPIDSVRGAQQDNPAWSSLGKVAYEDMGVSCIEPGQGFSVDPNLWGIWVIDPLTLVIQRVVPGGTNPNWSPDGSKLVFAAGQLYVVNADGSSLTQITSTIGVHLSPSWSPDAQWIAYDDDRDVWVVHSDGSDARNLSSVMGPIPALYASWSPDGTKILHVRYPADRSFSDIYLMNADGTGLARLTNNRTEDADPVYSPDGQRIAYTGRFVGADDDQTPHIWVMNADGTSPRQVTSKPGGTHPSWSPDGQRIVFARYNGTCGFPDFGILWTVDVDTGIESRLTRATAGWCGAVSSYDGHSVPSKDR